MFYSALASVRKKKKIGQINNNLRLLSDEARGRRRQIETSFSSLVTTVTVSPVKHTIGCQEGKKGKQGSDGDASVESLSPAAHDSGVLWRPAAANREAAAAARTARCR